MPWFNVLWWFEDNFLPQVYLENAKNSVHAEGSHHYIIFSESVHVLIHLVWSANHCIYHVHVQFSSMHRYEYWVVPCICWQSQEVFTQQSSSYCTLIMHSIQYSYTSLFQIPSSFILHGITMESGMFYQCIPLLQSACFVSNVKSMFSNESWTVNWLKHTIFPVPTYRALTV